MTPLYEPEFSDYSYGFCPGKHAHQVLEQVQGYASAGKVHVIELDLEKFFDRVNHDRLISKGRFTVVQPLLPAARTPTSFVLTNRRDMRPVRPVV